jgi:Integrase core domain
VKRSRSWLIAASAPTVSSRCWIDWLSPHGAPHYVRFDNGPEFVAHAVHDWCRFHCAGSLFIDPGSPWQNAWIESFNGRLRDELLNAGRFDSLLEARVIIEDWRRDYNANRPHSAHGELTPAEFALTVDHDPSTPSRIATGPPNGSPSLPLQPHGSVVVNRLRWISRSPRCDPVGMASE